ncbi:MAG: hypothetical protein MRY81_02430 [Donghicola eburneus]|nr:calcium-binding protein [Donghicola eburneus]MCI5038517.1 hypothetical protein [Donghicola eburneus]
MATIKVFDVFSSVVAAYQIDITENVLFPPADGWVGSTTPEVYPGGIETNTFEYGGYYFEFDISADEVLGYVIEEEILVLNGSALSDSSTQNGLVNALLYVWEPMESWDSQTLIFATANGLPEASVQAHLDGVSSVVSLALAGNDLLYNQGYSGQVFDGFAGDDLIIGNRGNDTLIGNVGNDFLLGEGGYDRLIGGAGDDELYGLNGNDKLFGGAGQDTLVGDEGKDRLYGGKQNDWLDGGALRDILKGNAGRDTLTGGTGNDKLFGGAGRDTFVFNAYDGRDRVKDFEAGFDRVMLQNISADDVDDLKFRQKGDHAILNYGEGKVVFVEMDVDDLANSDFLFV